MDGVPIDLWLDLQDQSRPAIVVPYARAREETLVRYRIVLDKEGSAGRSHVSQGGTVLLNADVATPLSRMAVNFAPEDRCVIEVSVLPEGEPPVVKSFDCPR